MDRHASRRPVKDPAAAAARARRSAPMRSSHLCMAATGIGLAFLASILATLFAAASGLNLKVFTEVTRPPGSDGGLLNAIAGS